MSKMFTQEEAERILDAIQAFEDEIAIPITGFRSWLLDHTEKPLTFPCPICKQNIEPHEWAGRWVFHCSWSAGHTLRITRNTKAELSEALNENR